MKSGGVLVRAPNHLGDLVMALPALREAGGDVLVAQPLAPLLEPAGLSGTVIPFRRGLRGLTAAAGALRPRRYRRGILLTPSFSSALLFLMGRVRERVGTDTDGRGPLLTERIGIERLRGRHRVCVYHVLVTGEEPATPPVPTLAVPTEARERWRHALGRADQPLVGVFPGSNAASRRWAVERFAALVETLAAEGRMVVVFGGPGEVALTRMVAGRLGIDVGGRTDLPTLAAALSACQILITNDSGPLHLAAAVGTRTVSLWGAGDPVATAVTGPGHRLLRHAELPCVPCVKNTCPRHGVGYLLPRAEKECLQLIQVPEVLAAVRGMAD